MKNHTQIEAVKRIRAEYPTMPQRKLARLIAGKLPTRVYKYVPQSVHNDIFRCWGSFATNYNRIRRIDGSIK